MFQSNLLSSEEIISLSQSKIVNSKSFSFDLKHKNGSTELPEIIIFLEQMVIFRNQKIS